MDSFSVLTTHSLSHQYRKLLSVPHEPQFYAYNFSSISVENCTIGTRALEQLGYNTDHCWIWYDQIGLVGLSLIFLLITYINLLTTKNFKITAVCYNLQLAGSD